MAPTIRLKQIDPLSYKKLRTRRDELHERLHMIRQRKVLCRTTEKINSLEDTSSEWFYLVDEEARLLKEIESIESDIFQCTVVEETTTDSSAVRLGTKVTLSIAYSEDDVEEDVTYVLVSMYPDIYKNEISKSSPIGAAIFGKHVGDQVSFTVPATGSTAVVKILSIHNI